MNSQQLMTPLKRLVNQSADLLLKAQTLDQLNYFFEELYIIAEHSIRAKILKSREEEKTCPLTDAEMKNVVIAVDEIGEAIKDDLSMLFKQLEKSQLEQLLRLSIISYTYYNGVQDQLGWSANKEKDPVEKKTMENELEQCSNAFGLTHFFIAELSLHENLHTRISAIEEEYSKFENYVKDSTKNKNLNSFRSLKLDDIHTGNHFLHGKSVFIEKFLPQAQNSHLLRYVDGDQDGTGLVTRKNKEKIPALKTKINAIEKNKTLTETEKLEQLRQAFLEMYYCVRKDQGWFDSALADALEAFLTSPMGLNLSYHYGPACVVPHHIHPDENPPILANIKQFQDHLADKVLIYFNGQNGFNAYMKTNHLGFTPNETIDLKEMDDCQKSRIRYIVYEQAMQLLNSSKKKEIDQGISLVSLLSKSIIAKDELNYLFSVAHQKLMFALQPLHLKKYKTSIQALMESLENIRRDYRDDEKKAYDAMKELVILTCSQLKQKVIAEKRCFPFSLFCENNLFLQTLEKFAKIEFKINHIQQFTGDLPVIGNAELRISSGKKRY